MRYRFNETNIATGLIKELLKEFNLPMYTVYTEGKPIYPGKLYIKNSTIYVGEGSGDSAELVPVNDYIYNQKQINMTKNLVINSSVYDSYTHTYLGNYLRFMRDYNRLNLMPLYNCFNTETLEGVNQFISLSSGNTFEINTYNTSNTYYLIPIKFNEQYTIAIDSPVTYELACMIHTPSGLTDLSKELMADTYKKIPGSQFSSPYLFSTDFDATKYWSFENNLRLLIKLPDIASNSTITVLEGNYTASARCQNSIVSSFAIDDKNDFGIYPTRLSLLDMNDGISYPFADRLLEYLSNNAIVPQEKITDNIGRLQRAVYNNSRFKGAYDIWDPQLRISLFNRLSDKTNKKNFYNIYREEAGNTPASKMSLLLGNTTQKTLSGKNLIPVTATTQTMNGVTFTVNEDGTVRANGTATTSFSFNFFYRGSGASNGIPLTAGKTYVLSTADMQNYPINIQIMRNEQPIAVYCNQPFTAQDGDYVSLVWVWRQSGTVFNNALFAPQFEVGSTPTAYEPYCGGIPSPNPDYPQEIHSVSGDNEIRVVGFNVWDEVWEVGTIGNTGENYNATDRIRSKNYIPVNPNATYYYWINSTYGIYTWGYDANKNYVGRIPSNGFAISKSTVTIPADVHYIRIVVQAQYGTVYKNDICINVSSSRNGEYEPYKAQVYPINLPVHNYLRPNFNSQTINGVTITKNADGTITCNGTATATVVMDIDQDTPLTVGKSYFLSGCPVGGNINTHFKLDFQDTSYHTDMGSGASINSYSPNADSSFDNKTRLVIYSGEVCKNLVFKPMIREAEITKASYTPYGVAPIELNALSTFKDYIHKENGKWWVHKATNKATLTGSSSEGWQLNSSGTYTKYQWSAALPDKYNVANTSICSNYFTQITVSQGDAKNVIGIAYGVYPSYSLQIVSSISTLAEWKTWLSTHNTEVIYPLATPTETEITDATLISQLEELSKATGYDDGTNIIQINSDLPFDIFNLEKIIEINKEIAEESKPVVDINENIKFIDTTPDLLSYGDKDVETFLGVAR